MRNLTIILIFAFYAPGALGSAQPIICGWQSGEIFFEGVILSRGALAGFYYSPDYGETIELRDSLDLTALTGYFGRFLTDADRNTIHRIYFINGWETDHLLSRDGGYTWEFLDSTIISSNCYASGVISGEIYRSWYSCPNEGLERSESYGANYTLCACIGFPDSSGIGTIALGSEPGEVYIMGGGQLYYSSDYAENFTYLGDVYQSFGIWPYSALINGAEPGEVYAHYDQAGVIWRIYNYGADADLIFIYDANCVNGIATTSNPGELYYYYGLYDPCPPNSCGIMGIFHTTDYFQTWTEYEHVIDLTGFVQPPQQQYPQHGLELSFGPNPANPSFTVEYNLQTAQSVELAIFNLIGQSLWQHQPGLQMPGRHRVFFDGATIPSGTYILQLQSKEGRTAKTITILK